MKTLLSLAGGALTVTEAAGVVSLNVDATASLGGGAAAGLVKAEGKGSISLDGNAAMALAAAVLNAHLPAALVPVAELVEAGVEAAVKAQE